MQIYVRLRSPKALPMEMALNTETKLPEAAE
jgi:hypothetical protein